MKDIDELIGRYWALAYHEGKTGESRGDEANEVLFNLRAAIEADRAQRAPDGKVLVDRGALNMVINALRRDSAEGRAVRGEMADALLASTPAPAQQDIPLEFQKVLSDNLWDLYADGAAQHQEQPQQEKCPSCRTGSIYACTCPFPTARNQEQPQQERGPMTEQERHALFVGLLSETADKPTEMFRLIVERVERHHGIRKD